MPRFKNRQEYEEWKAKRLEEGMERAERKKSIEKLMPHYSQSRVKEVPEPKPFTEQLHGIFSYPFKGHGIYLLAVGAVFFWILGFIPLMGIIVGGYLSAYMMKIIRSSADGEDEVPDWPDFSDFWSDILDPAIKVSGTTIVSFTPFLLYLFFSYPVYEWFITFQWVKDPIIWLLLLLGSLYYPMGLLAVAQADSLLALNPGFIIRSIITVAGDY